jgi:hypothetical protein
MFRKSALLGGLLTLACVSPALSATSTVWQGTAFIDT